METAFNNLTDAYARVSNAEEQIETATKALAQAKKDCLNARITLHEKMAYGLTPYAAQHNTRLITLRYGRYSLLFINDHTVLLLRTSYRSHSFHEDCYEKTDWHQRLFIGVGCRHCLSRNMLGTIAEALRDTSVTTILSLNSDHTFPNWKKICEEDSRVVELDAIVWKDWMSQPVPPLASVHPDLWTYDIRQRLEE